MSEGNEHLRFVRATEADLRAVIGVLADAGRWLHDVIGTPGDWPRHPNSLLVLNRFIRPGEMYLALLGDKAVGTARLTTDTAAYWDENAGGALYVYALAVRRDFAGQGIGRRLLAFAESEARRQGLACLRLDCWYGNARLRRYYREAGLNELAVHPDYPELARFEKQVNLEEETAVSEAKIMTLHPEGKEGVNISKPRYDVVRAAILAALGDSGSMEFGELVHDVAARLETSDFDGSIPWYVTTVKLDLEARGEIERVPGSSPQVLRLAE